MSVESFAFTGAIDAAQVGQAEMDTYVMATAMEPTSPARVIHAAHVRGLWDAELPALAHVIYLTPRPRYVALCIKLEADSPHRHAVHAFLSGARMECSANEVYLEDVAFLDAEGGLEVVLDPDTLRPVPWKGTPAGGPR